jgi:hypothetical protein
VNKSSLTGRIPAELRDVVIVRTARILYKCVCAEEVLDFTVHSGWPYPVGGVLAVSSTWPNLASAEVHAASAREHRPEAEVAIEPRSNPNYREGCLGDIKPGDLYFDYVGEAAFAESGRPYCQTCGIAVWSKDASSTRGGGSIGHAPRG